MYVVNLIGVLVQTPPSVQERTTKYISAVRNFVEQVGHATNAEILGALQHDYPSVSATTIHRITTRLAERGELQKAPTGQDNVLRFDANVEQHDHFMCSNCGVLKDAYLDDAVRPLIEKSIGDGCAISGRLVVSGICKSCNQVNSRQGAV